MKGRAWRAVKQWKEGVSIKELPSLGKTLEHAKLLSFKQQLAIGKLPLIRRRYSLINAARKRYLLGDDQAFDQT